MRSGPGTGGSGRIAPTNGVSQSLAVVVRNSATPGGSTSFTRPTRVSRTPKASCSVRNIDASTRTQSSSRQGAGEARRTRYSGAAAASARSPALTPSVYAAMSLRSAGGACSIVARARRRRPSRRVCASSLTVAGPINSESSPAARRLDKSIWKNRSCAWTNPSARATSGRVRPVMVGTPRASRAMDTGALRPRTWCSPASCGRLRPSWIRRPTAANPPVTTRAARSQNVARSSRPFRRRGAAITTLESSMGGDGTRMAPDRHVWPADSDRIPSCRWFPSRSP